MMNSVTRPTSPTAVMCNPAATFLPIAVDRPMPRATVKAKPGTRREGRSVEGVHLRDHGEIKQAVVDACTGRNVAVVPVLVGIGDCDEEGGRGV